MRKKKRKKERKKTRRSSSRGRRQWRLHTDRQARFGTHDITNEMHLSCPHTHIYITQKQYTKTKQKTHRLRLYSVIFQTRYEGKGVCLGDQNMSCQVS